MLARVLNSLIRLYQLSFAAYLGGQCRFVPSCSYYAREALTLYPLGKALKLIMKRLLKCHPAHRGGYDPA